MLIHGHDLEHLFQLEIIEETIRYIDALHSQLASRMNVHHETVASTENDPDGENSDDDDYAQQPLQYHRFQLQQRLGRYAQTLPQIPPV